MSNFLFNPFTEDFLNKLLTPRKGEIKIGEKLSEINDAEFIVLGIEESIGPVLNYGNPGAENAFVPFLNKFLNMQFNEDFISSKIAIFGSVTLNNNVPKNINVEELDDFIVDLILNNIGVNQKLIVIGGGHNNAYPIIKAKSLQFDNSLEVVNLDPHADFRIMEHRHSGNPFSFAHKNGYLSKYHVLGLHKPYNSAEMIGRMKETKGISFSFYEDYLDGKRDWGFDFTATKDALDLNYNPVGLELDLDAIANMPSSALTPSGVSLDIARSFIRTLADVNGVTYLHLPEGAPKNVQEETIIGKSLAYLVYDFISVNSSKK